MALLKPVLVVRTNGGEISLLERLAILKSFGHEVQGLIALPEETRGICGSFLKKMGTPLNSENEYVVSGIPMKIEFDSRFHPHELSAQTPMEDRFMARIADFGAEWLWAHYTDYFAVTTAMKWGPGRSFIVLTDNEYPRLEQLQKYPSLHKEYQQIRYLIVASRFMQREARRAFPNASVILVPNPIFALEGEVHASNEAWVFVNPVPVKGVDFMVELAKQMPSEKFLFVGNWTGEIPQGLPSNVETCTRQNDMRVIWARAKGLLMPSLWEEAFGRIVLEAMSAGIPVVTSPRGGLPQTVGDGGLVVDLEIPRWVDALNQLKKEGDLWVKRGFERVKDYRKESERRFQALQRWLQSRSLVK